MCLEWFWIFYVLTHLLLNLMRQEILLFPFYRWGTVNRCWVTFLPQGSGKWRSNPGRLSPELSCSAATLCRKPPESLPLLVPTDCHWVARLTLPHSGYSPVLSKPLPRWMMVLKKKKIVLLIKLNIFSPSIS